MFKNKKYLSQYKVGSLAVLLGIFGLFGSSVFAQTADGNGVTTVCKEGEILNAAGLCVEKIEALAAPGNGFNVLPNGQNSSTTAAKCGMFETLNSLQQCVCIKNYTKVGGVCKSCKDPGVCCGVKLNTNVPFIGKCIRLGSDADTEDTTVVTEATAFPRLMGGLTKIMTTIILLVCFGGILVGGVMIASSGGEVKRATEGKALIGKVIIAIALLGTSGIILKLINPNFFG